MKTHPSLPLLPTISSIFTLIRRTAIKSIAIWALLIALPIVILFAIGLAISESPDSFILIMALGFALLLYLLAFALLYIWGFLAAIHNANTNFDGGSNALRDTLVKTKQRIVAFIGFIIFVGLPGSIAYVILTLFVVLLPGDDLLNSSAIDSVLKNVLHFSFSIFAFIWMLAPAAIVIENLDTVDAMKKGSLMLKGRIIPMMGFMIVGYGISKLLEAGSKYLLSWLAVQKVIEMPLHERLPLLNGVIDMFSGALSGLWLLVVASPMIVVLFRTLRDLEAANTPASLVEDAPGDENKIDAIDGSAANAGI